MSQPAYRECSRHLGTFFIELFDGIGEDWQLRYGGYLPATRKEGRSNQQQRSSLNNQLLLVTPLCDRGFRGHQD